MKRTAIVTCLTSVGLVLAGCGGDPASEERDAGQLAANLGCTGFADDSEEIFVEQGGQCELDGSQIGVYSFADADARDGWIEAAALFGSGPLVVGDVWVVSDAPDPDSVAQKLGGSVQ